MSARMLRRALQQQQQQQEAIRQESDGMEDEEEEENRGARNIFDLLGSDENGGADDDEPAQDDVSPPPVQAQAVKQKEVKKKKGKKKQQDKSIDKILEELNISTPTPTQAPESRRVEDVNPLATEPKYLRAEEELRRIFGSKVVNEAERGSSLRRRKTGTRNFKLVAPLENWPRWDGGLSMEFAESKDGCNYFRYVHSSAYMEVQRSYEAMAATFDPNNIAMLLGRHPYHVDSLLTMADFCKSIGDIHQSAILLERCLYALECGWHLAFNPLEGKSRLSFAITENKALFYALHRHMQHLGRRGCHRTALEVCKLLLSLDPEDPLGAIFSIDYYALRTEQYEWLESFVSNYCKDLSLAILPNFAFSLAIARFYLEQRPKGSGAKEDSADRVPSTDLLQQALMLHPLVFGKIVAKAPIQEDPSWKKLLKHPFFSKASAGGPSLEHLIDIYVERNSVIWRAPELQKWLKTVASDTISAAVRGEASNWACARDEAFPAVHNEYQHLRVSEFSDAWSTTVPQELAHAPAEAQVPHDDIVELRDRNLLAVFLESMIPWTNYGSAAGPEEQEREQEQD